MKLNYSELGVSISLEGQEKSSKKKKSHRGYRFLHFPLSNNITKKKTWARTTLHTTFSITLVHMTAEQNREEKFGNKFLFSIFEKQEEIERKKEVDKINPQRFVFSQLMDVRAMDEMTKVRIQF